MTISANGNMMEKAKTNSNTSITGDFDVDVKLNRHGYQHLKPIRIPMRRSPIMQPKPCKESVSYQRRSIPSGNCSGNTGYF
ncbi:MAG: hypothetical protein ACLU4N_28085 [Butyricimonas faecihominis]